MEVVVEVVTLPKAGGAVVGAEVGAVEEALLLVIPPNPPNVGAVEADAGCDEVVVVAIEPKEGVAEVIADPNEGTVLEVPVVPNVGAVAADDDEAPKANVVEPAPNTGAAVAALVEKLAVAAGVDVGAVTAALVVSFGAAADAAPPNENGLLDGVEAAVVVTAGATGFTPKPNPPVELVVTGAAAGGVVVVVAVVSNAGTGAEAVVVAAAALKAGGLNALKPPVVPPKVTEVAVEAAG